MDFGGDIHDHYHLLENETKFPGGSLQIIAYALQQTII